MFVVTNVLLCAQLRVPHIALFMCTMYGCVCIHTVMDPYMNWSVYNVLDSYKVYVCEFQHVIAREKRVSVCCGPESVPFKASLGSEHARAGTRASQ